MFSIKNFSNKSYKFFKSVIDAPSVLVSDVISHINSLSDIICESIISAYFLRVLLNTTNEIKLADYDTVKQYSKFSIENEFIAKETNEYALIICIEGSVCIEYNFNNTYHVKLLNKKDAIIMSLNIDYNLNGIEKTEFKLAIFRYISDKPIIHYNNIVFSEDSIIYTKFNGYYFTICRLYNYDDGKLIDILITNDKLISLPLYKYLNFTNFKTFLKSYNINLSANFLDNIPKNKSKINDEINLLLTEETISCIIKHINKQYVLSTDNKLYHLYVAYVVACNK
ncbi:concanavalin-like precursor [Hypsugopox virus]|nr:concanavalin-like precursor [Hypsugopox virus]